MEKWTWSFSGGSALIFDWSDNAYIETLSSDSRPRRKNGIERWNESSINAQYSSSSLRRLKKARKARGYSDHQHHQAPLTRPLLMNEMSSSFLLFSSIYRWYKQEKKKVRINNCERLRRTNGDHKQTTPWHHQLTDSFEGSFKSSTWILN